jgi:hypothetical protein
LIGLLGCASGGLAPASRLSETDTAGVLEAVYRYQMMHDARADTEAFCLCAPADSRQGSDPSAELLERFASGARPVLACSACSIEEGRVIEKKSGRTALTFYVSSLRPLFSGDVEVEGGTRSARFSSTRLRYRVVREGARWTVTDALGRQVP